MFHSLHEIEFDGQVHERNTFLPLVPRPWGRISIFNTAIVIPEGTIVAIEGLVLSGVQDTYRLPKLKHGPEPRVRFAILAFQEVSLVYLACFHASIFYSPSHGTGFDETRRIRFVISKTCCRAIRTNYKILAQEFAYYFTRIQIPVGTSQL